MEWYVYQRGSSPIRKVSRKRRSRRKRNLLIAGITIVAAGLLWCAVVFNNINSAATTSPMAKADAGIILGMSMWGDKPSPGLKERLDCGLKLYREGMFSTFIVSGGWMIQTTNLLKVKECGIIWWSKVCRKKIFLWRTSLPARTRICCSARKS